MLVALVQTAHVSLSLCLTVPLSLCPKEIQDDEVVLQCTAAAHKEQQKLCLAAEGFGNRLCFLESTSNSKSPATQCEGGTKEGPKELHRPLTAEAGPRSVPRSCPCHSPRRRAQGGSQGAAPATHRRGGTKERPKELPLSLTAEAGPRRVPGSCPCHSPERRDQGASQGAAPVTHRGGGPKEGPRELPLPLTGEAGPRSVPRSCPCHSPRRRAQGGSQGAAPATHRRGGTKERPKELPLSLTAEAEARVPSAPAVRSSWRGRGEPDRAAQRPRESNSAPAVPGGALRGDAVLDAFHLAEIMMVVMVVVVLVMEVVVMVKMVVMKVMMVMLVLVVNVPPDLSICTFVLEQSLSVRALQEMLANTMEKSEGASI
ncbi:Ryanodine receptor 2 [Myotis davidii]|uniref:Ryanodine receptor 2 n=1 Tax=Myotis davidii TaxID=225400 RepID=L5M182_MYODS|nr:Ryanodine receptor 2 [Myotis davidii]